MDVIATINLVVTGLGFLVTVIVLAIGGIWKLAQMEKRQADVMKKDMKELHDSIDEVRELAIEQASLARREFGETVHAMQQKLNTLEVWTLSTFVRRDSHQLLIQSSDVAMKAQFDRIDARFDKIETKLDAMQQRPA